MDRTRKWIRILRQLPADMQVEPKVLQWFADRDGDAICGFLDFYRKEAQEEKVGLRARFPEFASRYERERVHFDFSSEDFPDTENMTDAQIAAYRARVERQEGEYEWFAEQMYFATSRLDYTNRLLNQVRGLQAIERANKPSTST